MKDIGGIEDVSSLSRSRWWDEGRDRSSKKIDGIPRIKRCLSWVASCRKGCDGGDTLKWIVFSRKETVARQWTGGPHSTTARGIKRENLCHMDNFQQNRAANKFHENHPLRIGHSNRICMYIKKGLSHEGVPYSFYKTKDGRHLTS